MIDQLFSIQFIILAVFINMIIFFIFNGIKPAITRGDGDNPAFGLPKVAIRNLIMCFVFGISFIATWVSVNIGYIKMLDDSIFLTSAWGAILSSITYNIGIKEIMLWFQKMFGNKIK